MPMQLEALSDELLARCFVEAGDSSHPADLARLACVSPRFRRVVDDRCWRDKAQKCFPDLAAVADAHGGAEWKALYKLCSFCPPPSLLLPGAPQCGCVVLPSAFSAVKAMLQTPGKGRRLTQDVHRRALGRVCDARHRCTMPF